jgi:predicted transcriptional regulator
LSFEILQVLKEWSIELKKLKVEDRHQEYIEIKKKMATLVGLRKLITDVQFMEKNDKKKIKELQDKVLRTIEDGSRQLNLDLIVRVEDEGDDKGKRATENNLPIITLYRSKSLL